MIYVECVVALKYLLDLRFYSSCGGGIVVSNPYKILGVTPSMSLKDIRSEYTKLAKMYHPDGTNGNAERFKEICEAWKLIKSCKEKVVTTSGGALTHVTLFTFRRVQ